MLSTINNQPCPIVKLSATRSADWRTRSSLVCHLLWAGLQSSYGADTNKVLLMGLLKWCALVFVAGFFLIGCRPEMVLPTPAALAATLPPAAVPPESPESGRVPPTWTAVLLPPLAPPTPYPTSTPRPPATPLPALPPTRTPRPTATEEITAVAPTDLPPPTEPPIVIASPPPTNLVLGPNILPNGSFEEGDYLQNGIPELQLPVGWSFEYDVGPTGFGEEIWDVYVRPEMRVLSDHFLPPEEHALYIYDGRHTIKAFKGYGAISFRLFREVYLEPGRYQLEINLFPDLVMEWQGTRKIWADDPESGEVRFIAPGAGGWLRPAFGRKNSYQHQFAIETAQTVRIGAAIRGNHAIVNNGWFLDDWSLRRIED